MNTTNTYSIKIVKAENGFLLTREDIVNKTDDNLGFDEYETKLFVFPDNDGVVSYLKENLQ